MSKKFVGLEILDTLTEDQLNKLVNSNIQILCKNYKEETQMYSSLKLMQKKRPQFWRNDSEWGYYLTDYDLKKVIGIEPLGDVHPDKKAVVKDKPKPSEEDNENRFGEEYEILARMNYEERMERFTETKDRIVSLAEKENLDQEEICDALITASRDSSIINKLHMDDTLNYSDEEAKKRSQDLVTITSEVVDAAQKMLSSYKLSDELFTEMVEVSNGSTVKHMTRVFIKAFSFLLFFNELVLRTELSSKLRVDFSKKYRNYYQKLLPHLSPEEVTLERVFKNGIGSINDREIHSIALGFLLHDIGKQIDITYFESDEEYNWNRITAHVSDGFKLLLQKTIYPTVVSVLAGFHHEYYNHPTGYGNYRQLLKKFQANHKFHTLNYCISFSVQDVITFNSYAYFPVKILEITDVYDALTDPGRKYRSPMTSQQATEFMKEKFIDEALKIDPILFNLFVIFLKENGEI